MQTAKEREFVFSDSNFVTIAKMVKEEAGIVLGDRKRDLVYGRLARRLRALGFDDFSDYCAHLNSVEGVPERRQMVNAITTNLTAFFREAHHFAYLENTILPQLLRSASSGDRRLRIWSAGCSSGEEPYTIAMILRNAIGNSPRVDAKILATDIDTQMVATATAGRYPSNRADSIPPAMRAQFVTPAGQDIVMSDALKSLIVFNPLNLFDSWPMRGPFDVIFCRNVIIYFDNESKRALIDRYADLLKPNGWLFIGHSESLFQVTNRFRQVGKTIHQRIA